MGIEIDYVAGPAIARMGLSDREILQAVESELIASGRGEAQVRRDGRIDDRPRAGGALEVSWAEASAFGFAGVEIRASRAPRAALLALHDAESGAPRAIVDAGGLAAKRIGAISALAALRLAPPAPRVLGQLGVDESAYWSARLLDRRLDFAEIRVHEPDGARGPAFAERLSAALDKRVISAADARACVDGADVVIDAARASAPAPRLDHRWVRRGALVIAQCAGAPLTIEFPEAIDSFVTDDLSRMRTGPLGALAPHIETGLIDETSFRAEIGEIAANAKPGRKRAEETILVWHRGLAASDLALAAALWRKARRAGLARALPFS